MAAIKADRKIQFGDNRIQELEGIIQVFNGNKAARYPIDQYFGQIFDHLFLPAFDVIFITWSLIIRHVQRKRRGAQGGNPFRHPDNRFDGNALLLWIPAADGYVGGEMNIVGQIEIFRQAGQLSDDLFWRQCIGMIAFKQQ